MSGIDKIIEQIQVDTKAVCNDIIAKAEHKSENIIAEAQKKADFIKEKSEKDCAAKVIDIKKRGDSAAELEEKRILLKTKQEIISSMLSTGIEKIKALPDEEYFTVILKMVKKYSLAQDGVIRFGKRDISRMPSGFITKINESANGKIVMSDECADIDAGFILIYGGIEENCSLDAIFLSEDEALKDRAGKLLF